jgi:acetoin utilization protein AcuB
MQIKDVMTSLPFTVRPSMSVTEARAEMSRRHIRHLIVLDEGGLLLGMVTDRDVRLNLPSPATSLSVWEVNYLLGRLTVGEIMKQPVLTVDPARDVREAARILIDHKIGALPVTDGFKLVGIVTETDLLHALAVSPAELVAKR